MKKAVLYYFPYAGATTVSFKNIENYFSDEIEPVCLEYAAHGKRIKEKNYASITELASDMADQIKKHGRTCDEARISAERQFERGTLRLPAHRKRLKSFGGLS